MRTVTSGSMGPRVDDHRPFPLVGSVKALITGAGGFVGPYLARCLESNGDDVVGLDAADGPDLLDGDGWRDALDHHRPDVLYHLAGWSDVGASWAHPTTTFRLNAEGTLSVLEAAVAAKTARVVLVSSADVYGIVAEGDLPLTEDHPVQPRSPYGVSKQAAEALGQQYRRAHDLGVVVARPFNHIGPGQRPQFAAPAFASQVARAERDGGGELLHGDLSARRDLTDVRDVVRAYRLLAEHGEPGEIYNICQGRAVSMQHVLDHLVGGAQAPITTAIDPTRLRPVELPVLVGSHQKLTDATGWRPEIPLERSLDDVLNHARAVDRQPTTGRRP